MFVKLKIQKLIESFSSKKKDFGYPLKLCVLELKLLTFQQSYLKVEGLLKNFLQKHVH